jgi:hypothetical protein
VLRGTGGVLGGIQGAVTSYPGAMPVLSVFVRAFRTPDLRKKLLFTGAIVGLFRFGSNLPAPGISEQNVSYPSVRQCAGLQAVVKAGGREPVRTDGVAARCSGAGRRSGRRQIRRTTTRTTAGSPASSAR